MLAELKKAGLKLTPQRLAIVRELAHDTSHPTAQELYERLLPAHPTMSFATVYNTLDALAKLGLVGTLRLGSAVRFDPNRSSHHHAVCDRCGKVVDLPAAPSKKSLANAEAQSGFHLHSEERTYRGLCDRCS
jgi:Fur family peroxide stress response transcriptional regulator